MIRILLNIRGTMNDGNVCWFTNTITYGGNGHINKKYVPDSLLDIENVRAVSINGNIIKFRD